jgi:signal transduction histidine kinase
MLAHSEPAAVDAVIRPLRDALTIGAFVAITARLGGRLRGASHLARRSLGPVLGVAILRVAAYVVALAGRRVAQYSVVVEAAAWLIAITVPMMAAAFLVGVWRWRLFIATAMQRLAARMRRHADTDDLRVSLADAFDDPALEIVYWSGDEHGHWADASGQRVPPPSSASRSLTELHDENGRSAAIVHDAALADDHAFVDTATAYAAMTLDNQRLHARAGSLLREVRESRARIQSSADDERRRIEHDLHDGAQQRLVALRIKLELAAERMGDRHGSEASLLRELGSDVEDALDEVRSLARGIYPAPLAERGLAEALRSAALHAVLPTTVLAAGIRRYSREVESAAYFSCLEALQNAAKHARSATAVVIELSDNGALHFEVRDDGAGFDARRVAPGVGLTSLRDRLAAVGGEVTVQSRPGHGTRVSASIPLSGGNGAQATTPFPAE